VLGQVQKARLTPARVLDALRDPHYRTGYALVANTVGTTAVGFFYWVVAAHLYDRQALGRCSALVSALIVVSALAQLDLPTILPRFLPQAGRSAGRFIAYGYGASSVAALAVGVGFVTILPRLSPQWQFLRTSPSLAILFVAALVIWGVFALEDAALTALHRAVVVPVENSVYGVAKLLLLVVMATVLPSTGVFAAWLVPLLAIVPAVNWLIFRRYVRLRDAAKASTLRAREIIRFALLDYLGSLFAQGYGYVLPLLVLSVLGAAANSSFFVAWTIASALELAAYNFGTSLLVEGIRAPGRLAELTRGVLIRCGLITVSGAAVMAAGGRIILRLFGPAYGDAYLLLALLGTATIPISVVVVTLALDRIAGRTGRVALTQLALAVLVLGLSVPLMKKFGIEGVGFACLTAGLVVALVRFPSVVHAIRQPGAVVPAARPEREPVLAAATETSEHTIILSPLAWGAARYQVALGHVTRPAEDDMTVILSPMAWLAAPDHTTGNVARRPDEDMTMLLSPLTLSSVRDQVLVGNIPKQPPGFLPRPALQAQLNQHDPVIVVTGKPGTGKTQLAAAYARARLEGGWRLVAWVDAQNAGSLRAGLAAVAHAERLPSGGPEGLADLSRLVRRLLEADGHRCLLVLDNAEDLDLLRPVIPRSGAAQVMIVTSRPPTVNLGTTVSVDALGADEALAVLDGRTGLADDQGAAAVAAELSYLPLGLTLAGGVIADRHLRYSRYLERLAAMPAGQHPVPWEPEPYPPGVAKAALLALEEAAAADRSGVSARVLEIMAVLPGSGVDRELLHAAGEAGVLAKNRRRPEVSAELVDVALAGLAERSLLAVGVDGKTVMAQRLIVHMVRDQLSRRGRLVAVCRAAASVLDMRAAALAGSPDRSAIRDILVQVAALRENTAGFAAEDDDELARTLLSLRFWALYDLNELGDSASAAIAIGKPLVADSQRVLGSDHPDTLTAQNNLAVAYQEAGRAAEAIPLFARSLEALERRLGPDHRDAVTTRDNLAIAYREAGQAAEAIPLLEQTLAALVRRLGAEHPSAVTTRNNLAVAYQEAGRAAEAIPLFERTQADLQRLMGPDHPDVVTARNNLACVYDEAARGK
jgi:O-antigen/teichoic acid export membrane protein/tetratricopeptide (TPR) repeat protein